MSISSKGITRLDCKGLYTEDTPLHNLTSRFCITPHKYMNINENCVCFRGNKE